MTKWKAGVDQVNDGKKVICTTYDDKLRDRIILEHNSNSLLIKACDTVLTSIHEAMIDNEECWIEEGNLLQQAINKAKGTQ